MFIGHPLFGGVFSWTMGAVDTLWKVIRTGKKFDLYVGSNNLNAFMGIILKKFKRVKKVVFFSPDYSHNRFENSFLNSLYHWLDYYCLKNADLVWNSSAEMEVDLFMKEREKRGVPSSYRKKQIQVPDDTDPIEVLPIEKINRHEICFVGHLKKGMGVELLIEAFPEITKKVPDAKLLVIGSGPVEKHLRQMADGMNIEFTGFIGDLSEVYRLLSKCAIGTAPYEEGTISQYSDPGKTKLYLSVGLPIVITRVPQVALEIEKEECGVAINPSKEELTAAVTSILKDDSLFMKYRENSIRLSKKYNWDNIFDRALSYL